MSIKSKAMTGLGKAAAIVGNVQIAAVLLCSLVLIRHKDEVTWVMSSKLLIY